MRVEDNDFFFLLCGYETDLLSEQLSSSSAVVWYESQRQTDKCVRDAFGECCRLTDDTSALLWF